jgi:pimeloyl-ACP methyl ester carboxylesterase
MPTSANIYYFENKGGSSQKAPIVLIHGAGGTHLHWPAQLRRFNNYRVYAIDLPGHGKSEGHGQQSIDGYVHKLVNWMQALKLFRAVFVGHSMGGAIAMQFALQHPDLVLGLGLVGTGARLRVAPAILENAGQANTSPAAVGTIIKWAFSPKADPRLVELAAERMAETRPSVLHGDFLACDHFDIMETLDQIHVPTLILCGEDDQLTPCHYSQYLYDHIPNATLKTFSEAGHMVMLEKPHQVAEALSEFMRQISFSI